MTGLFLAAQRGTHLSNFDAESLLDQFLSSVQRATIPATAVLYSQQRRQLEVA
jgi:hypothetical protein